MNPKKLYTRVANNAGVFKISDDELKRVHKVQLEILDDVLSLCNKEGLTVMLQAGSLIGAVLYKGYIPWDDDIDLFMTRNDYDRLLDVLPGILGHKYIVQTPKSEPCATFGFMKIRKRNTLFVEVETSSFPIHKGIFIDICPLENAPNSRILRFFHGICCIILKQIATARALYKYPSCQMKILSKYSTKLRCFILLRSFFGFVFSFLTVGKWTALAEKLCALFKDTKTDYFSVPYSGALGYFKELYRKEMFLPPKKLEFEKRMINVPSQYDYILKRKYGDYTIIPPPEKRTQHWVVELDFGD